MSHVTEQKQYDAREEWKNIGQMINVTSFMWRIISHNDPDDESEGRNFTYHINVTVDWVEPVLVQEVTRAVYLAAAVMLSIIVVVGVIGNSMVIYVIAGHQRFRTVTNLLLLNLSLADLLFLLVCGTLGVLHRSLGEWLLGDGACRFMQYLLYVTVYVTIYTITAVAVVRYVIVTQETPSAPLVDKQGVACIIGAAWLLFALLNIPILLIHGLFREPTTDRYECLVVSRQRARELYATFFVFAYALPLTVIATLYILIIRHIRQREAATCGLLNGKRPSMERRERHIVRAAMAVVAVFALCWLPLHVHLLIAYFGDSDVTGGDGGTATSRLLIVFWHVLAYSNSVFNPIIYNLFSHEFRLATLALFRFR
jgi:allatostatin receptor